jgi:hypothetical protein
VPIWCIFANACYSPKNVGLLHDLHILGHQANLMHMDPVIVASARKHGISDDDMLHAYRNPMRVFELDDLVMLMAETNQAGCSKSACLQPKASSSSSMQCPPARSS